MPKLKTAERCDQCARASARRTNRCEKCAGPVSTRRAVWCRKCRRQNATDLATCPICGGYKSWSSTRCYDCDQAAKRTEQGDWHGIVQSFNPIAFRNEISRADLEWSTRRLAEVAGVSRSTIDGWLAGNTKPSRVELDAVVKVLAFEVCQSCNGLGHVDPTQSKQQTIERRVTRPSNAPLPVLKISVAPSVPVSVGRLLFDPTYRELRLDGTTVQVTRSEAAMLTVLAHNIDRLLTSAEIAQLACISGGGAVRTHLGRLKPKLAQIGARFYLVSGPGSGVALSAQCEHEDRRPA